MNHRRHPACLVAAIGLVFALQFPIGSAGPVATAAQAEPWIHVKVIETGPDAETVRVNVPLSLFEALAPLMQSAADKDHAEESDDESPDAATAGHHHHRHGQLSFNDHDVTPAEMRAMLQAFRQAEDGEYITVDGTDERVRVTKSGGYFLVDVDDRGEHPEQVKVKIQMKVVEALLSGGAEELNFRAAAEALRGQSGEDLVTVTSDDETVHIWIDEEKTAD